jgi:hypothetical protein
VLRLVRPNAIFLVKLDHCARGHIGLRALLVSGLWKSALTRRHRAHTQEHHLQRAAIEAAGNMEADVTIAIVLLILALICFVCAALGVASRIGLTPLGLAFLTAYLLLGSLA